MRLRTVSDASVRLEQYSNYIKCPEDWKGRWPAYFGNKGEIHIEIGSGKGRFMTTLAQNNPHINYIAIERSPTVLLQFMKKMPEDELKNLAIFSIDAAEIEKYFAKDEISKIYLNFSDPWPKKRHTKRRLTSSSFISLYKNILKNHGLLEFKTDNRGLFDFSLEEFNQSCFELEAHTFDLYNSPLIEGNIQTEYEERFSNMGTPINKLIARLKKSGDISDEVCA